MVKIKSHKSVEDIAKKHRIDVSFVQKQLDMGIPIEHEHTKDKDLATDIALQHLDEIPDYYTRLKKMESDAKKSHDKKYKDVTEEKKGLWYNIRKRREKGLPRKKPGQEGYPKTLDIKEGIKQARKNVGASKCWTGKKLGNPPTKIKGGKEVPNCVAREEIEMNDLPVNLNSIRYCPACKKDETRSECKCGEKYWDTYSLPTSLGKKNDPNSPHPGNFPESKSHEVKTFHQFMEDWQSSNRKDGVDGLSQSTVNKYRDEHPGSKLQTAVTEKNPKGKRAERRANFCSRMSGMKDKLTSAETARDPDSNINKALRRWRCR